MLIPRWGVWVFSVAVTGLGTGAAYGQDFPSKPVRIITSGVGGTADLVARVIAQGVSGALGQPVIVDNRATGIIQEIVAKAPPDGYTLLLTSASHWLLPLMRENVAYDPVRDFSPITLTTILPNILVVHPSLPVKSVKELIALARSKPGDLNYATTGTGNAGHLAAELFKALAGGVDMVRINYKSSASALGDLVGGHVHLMFPTAGSVTQHVKSGKLRALAVTSARPSATFPELPTVAEAGVAGYELVAINGMFAPARTPATIINRLNQEIVRVLNRADVKEKLFNLGVEPVGSTPEEFAATMKSQMARMGKVIRDAGIRIE